CLSPYRPFAPSPPRRVSLPVVRLHWPSHCAGGERLVEKVGDGGEEIGVQDQAGIARRGGGQEAGRNAVAPEQDRRQSVQKLGGSGRTGRQQEQARWPVDVGSVGFRLET